MNITLSSRFSIFELIKEKYQFLVFGIYLILLTIVVSHHEPWMDEAQAWLLAKDTTFKDLFIKYLRYEGSPGLWHLILMLPAKIGLPYSSINVISAFFSAIGVWLFIRYAPFPPFIKILFPFTYFIFFQYGVVARSYCLISPILFLIAITYHQKEQHPFRFVFLLGLLANISAHTFIIAGCIAFVHFLDVIKKWKVLDKTSKTKQIVSFSILGTIALLVIYIISTPQDQLFAGHANFGFKNFCIVTQRMIAGSLVMNEFNSLTWLYGSATLAIIIVTVNWLGKTRLLLLYILPLLLICILFAVKYRSFWHQGVLFLLWIFVLWVSFEKYKEHVNAKALKSVLGTLGVVLAVQAYWCIEAINYDLNHYYSGSYKLAKYLKAKGYDKEKIYVSGWRNISVLPYFPNNIFYNHNNGADNKRFWNWSVNNVTSVGAGINVIDTIQCEQPNVVIFASDHIPSRKKIFIPGYKPVAFFEGYLCWKTGLLEPECYLVFKKNEDEVIEIAETKPASSARKDIN